MSLGERLLDLRKSKHLSQEELADKLNVTRQTISKWETDQSTPDLDKIMPLCKLYGISSDELLTGVKEENHILESKEETKKNKLGLVIGIFLIFISIAWVVFAEEGLHLSDGIYVPIFLLILAIGICVLIYTNAGSNTKKVVRTLSASEKKYKQIKSIIAILITIVYLSISFLTNAWHITWILWIIYVLITRIIKLIFMLNSREVGEMDE